ncbi:PilZ domain-containing protein [Stakelama saccharophila]|uniref:PilZ domain-containing protein n=1 Tax=Stakelama saccharophila TaxID=3075605 RepID=A0ABZ0B929_9SPHN|nr:PilZ domain-containing protein [Stakelama sp. W311]WNO53757.1 PilZ domain-containing protein [Stakelama sp. W311]
MVDPSVPSGSDQRRALRKCVEMRAQLRGRGGQRFTVAVTDLSTTGFRAEAAFDLKEGDLVWLTMPGMQGLEATVAWRDGYIYGFAFARPLYPAVFDRIVASSEA